MAFYFGDHALSLFGDGLYFQDGDDDGASNIMEYYGLDMSSLFVDTRKSSSAAPIIHHGLQDGPWPSAGTDPTLADTNGDLFNDGYQLAYDLLEGDVTEDTDGDGLTDFQEFRYSTNPFSSDTDSDGVSDWEEIEQGSDPLDPNDSLPSDVGSIDLSLSIGDPSGSHSERYTMMVGIIQHAAPYFGVVNTDVYSFPPGVYSINIRHRDSTLGTPDFDYYGGITWPPTLDFDVSIQDPEGLLGTHSESTSDFTIGKTATLTIIYTGGGGGCSGQQQDGSVRRRAQTCPAFPCSSYTSCAACLEERTRCDWVVNLKRCRKMGAGGGKHYYPISKCPCDRCQDWGEEQKKDLGWIETLPLCPCSVIIRGIPEYRRGVNVGTSYWLDAGSDAPGTWLQDAGCTPKPSFTQLLIGRCGFHPGAYGCIRAKAGTHGQQCCYNNVGKLITDDRLAAGSPDKVYGSLSSYYGHKLEDITPFNLCCDDCEDAKVCRDEYVGHECHEPNPTLCEDAARSDVRRGCWRPSS